MIRTAFVTLLAATAILVGSLWAARREASDPVRAPAAPAEVRTFDLGGLALLPGVSAPQSPAAPGAAESAAVPGQRAASAPPRSAAAPALPPTPSVTLDRRVPFAPDEPLHREPEIEPTAAPLLAAGIDQDAWAQRIRRMLSVYRRTGERP